MRWRESLFEKREGYEKTFIPYAAINCLYDYVIRQERLAKKRGKK